MSKRKLVSTTLIGVLSSLLSFLGIVSCCGFPLLAAFLAWFGIGASQLDFFSRYQYVFSCIAILALAYGFYTIYFKTKKKKQACCSEVAESCCTPSKKKSWIAQTMLWIGLIAVISSFFMSSSSSNSSCCTIQSDSIEQTQEKTCSCSKQKKPNKLRQEDSNDKKSTKSCCIK